MSWAWKVIGLLRRLLKDVVKREKKINEYILMILIYKSYEQDSIV